MTRKIPLAAAATILLLQHIMLLQHIFTASGSTTTAFHPTIRIINLDNDTQRWEQVTQQFRINNDEEGTATAAAAAAAMMKIQRLPAVNGKTLTDEEIKSAYTSEEETRRLWYQFCVR